MTDPYVAAPEPRTGLSRGAAFLVFVTLFGAGFVGVLTMLLLRAPDEAAAPRIALLPPEGYVLLDDRRSGGGVLDETGAATALKRDGVPGFLHGVLRAWGRRPGEPPRSVVVLAVEVTSPRQALTLRGDYVAAARRGGATAFATPGLDAHGFHDVPDRAGRHAQRVVLTSGQRLFVVSVVTPEREADTAEVVALAQRQAAAG